MTLLVAPALALLLVLLGRLACRPLADPSGDLAGEPALGFAVGAVLAHVVLLGSSLAGIPWSSLGWTVPLLIGVVAWATPRRAAREPWALGLGDAVAALAVAVFSASTLAGWVTTSDFIYHWGSKARRFAFFDGLDWSFLSDGGNWRVHVDYPELWNELLAVTIRLQRALDEAPQLLWGPTLLALTILSLRTALRAAGARGGRLQALVALAGVGLSGFAHGQMMAGAADWFVILALLVAAPALLSKEADRTDDLRIGAGAALAAASKVEGVLCAALVIAVYLGREVLRPRRERITGWLLAAAPAGLLTASWLAINRHFGLHGITTFGPPQLDRLGAVLATSLEVAAGSAWQGLPVILLALPYLLARRRSCALGLVITAQIGCYLSVYLAAATDPVYYVLSSWSRLLLHIVPLALVGLVAATSPDPAQVEASGAP